MEIRTLKQALLIFLISISIYLFYQHSYEIIKITFDVSTDKPTNKQTQKAQLISSLSPVPERQSSDKSTAPQKGAISTTNNTRTMVLIISDYRSGSSLLGELFNQNNDVFYLFEPLIGFPLTKTRRFLQKLLTCNPPKWGLVRRNRQSGCPYNDADSRVTDQKCIHSVNHEVQCKKHAIIAAKFIRIRSIEEIISFGLLNNPNVFIVHSLRDPRGTINSRLMYDTINYNGKSVSRDNVTIEIMEDISDSLCHRYLKDSVSGEGIPESYVRVTYEELCANPEAAINKVYGLIGITSPSEVFEWFETHTQSGSNTSNKDKMGLKRDSQLTAVRWKTELSQEFICAIERKCFRLIDYLNLEYQCLHDQVFL